MAPKKQTSSNRKPTKTAKSKGTTPKRKPSARQKKFRKQLDLIYQHIGKGTLRVVICLILASLLYMVYQKLQSNSVDNSQTVQEDDSQVKQNFVAAIVTPAQRLQRQYGVLASVSMAQAMLESDFGRSTLASQYYNLFGVKTDSQDVAGVDLPTKEFVDNEWITITARFKVYESWAASMEEHAKLIYYGTSWDPTHYSEVIKGETYQAQAQALQEAGYATDPDYAAKLIHMIESWQLTQYDQPVNQASN